MRDAAAVWREVGLAVYHRRTELGIATQGDLAERAGVHLNTISRLERGRALKRRSPSWAAIEAALSWPEGKIADMVDGRDRETEPGPALTADVVKRAVLAAITSVESDVTVRQAHRMAAAAVTQFEQQGLLQHKQAG
jgi:transcriptional regulator with XRE-family HTH domain